MRISGASASVFESSHARPQRGANPPAFPPLRAPDTVVPILSGSERHLHWRRRRTASDAKNVSWKPRRRERARGPRRVFSTRWGAGVPRRQFAIRADDRRGFERQLAGGRQRQRKCRSGSMARQLTPGAFSRRKRSSARWLFSSRLLNARSQATASAASTGLHDPQHKRGARRRGGPAPSRMVAVLAAQEAATPNPERRLRWRCRPTASGATSVSRKDA